MKLLQFAMAATFCALAAAPASAQYVKGNEAVKVMPDGSRRVELPPVPVAGPASKSRPCAAEAGCNAGPWHMVETTDGLRECTEPFARPTTCRASSYGTKKLSRLWIAKRGPTWLWCQYPDIGSKCVDMHARPPANLPYDAVQ
ncbi:hypothetical protein [Methylibium sp. Root1272]|uniref:hypothetical protein n=1 Tax=Methylibium sp. Root1272 TaxID=1736441 RepID=UPI0009E77BA2|nr:hypothetical protein [Methylibium sp. Root1272]